MGGCATKPKELKGEAAEAPMHAKEEVTSTVFGATEVAVAEKLKKVEGEIVFDKEKEIVVDDTSDEHGNRRRSLSNLFKENEGEDSTDQDDKMPLDPVKQEEPSVKEKPTEVSKTKSHESGKFETPVEQTPRDFVEAPVEDKAEKAVEVAPARGTSAEKAIESPAATEMQKPEESKLMEVKPSSETQKLEMPEEKHAEKKPATETQKPETLA